MSTRSFACCGFASPISDFGHPDFFLFSRDHAQSELTLLVCGLGRSGFLMPVLDPVQMGSLTPMHSILRSGSAVFVLDHLHLGLLFFAHSFSRIEPAFSLFGVSCMNFFPSLLDHVCLESALFIRSLVKPDLALSLLDFDHLESFALIHSMACFDLWPFLFGLGRLELFLLVLDLSHLEPSMSTRGSSSPVFGLTRAGFVSLLSLIDAATFEPSMFLRSMACLDFFSLVPDFGIVDLSLSTRSSSKLDSALSLVDFAMVGFMTLIRSSAQPDFMISALDFVHLEPLLLLRDSAHLDFLMSLPGSSRSGSVFAMPVIDTTILGSSLSVHSSACFDFAMLALDLLHLEFSSLVQNSGRVDFAFSVCGKLQSDFLLFLLGFVHVGLPVFVRSFSCSGSLLFASDFAKPESSVFMHSFVRVGFAPLIFGLSRVGFVFFLPLIDTTILGFSALVRSFAYPESAMSVVDFVHMGFIPLIRGLAYLGPFLLVLDFLRLGFLASSKNYVHLESFLSPFGLARTDLVFFLSVIDSTLLGSFLSIRSSVHSGFVSFVLDLLHLGFPLLSRQPTHLDPVVLLSGAQREHPEHLDLVIDSTCLDPLLPARSMVCSELALLVLDFLHLGSSLFPHSRDTQWLKG
eukprot:s154_g50.t1